MMNQNMFCSNNNTKMNNHPNPSSIEDINNSYLHFPDPFLDEYHNLFPSHFLSQHQQIFNTGEQEQDQEQDQKQDKNSDKSTRNNKVKIKKCSSSSSSRKTGKKDRHSKIYTAQGPRDRRMRLSLQIARKFFDLQDMLGFDKASQTIEWLISNSNSAIQDLKHGSSNDLIAVSEIPVFMPNPKKTNNRPSRESRARARARARQRTILKKTQLFSISHQDLNSCFHFQDGILEEPHFQDCPTAPIQHKVFDDLLDLPSIHGLFSGNK